MGYRSNIVLYSNVSLVSPSSVFKLQIFFHLEINSGHIIILL